MPVRTVRLPAISHDSELHELDMSSNHESYVSRPGEDNPLRVQYYHRSPEKHVVAKVLFTQRAKGPPGHAHGGSMAAVFDETMGTAAWFNGHPVLAAGLEVSFRMPLPLGTTAWCEAWVDKVSGKKVHIAAVLYLENTPGTLFGTARGLFIRLPMESFTRAAEGGDLIR